MKQIIKIILLLLVILPGFVFGQKKTLSLDSIISAIENNNILLESFVYKQQSLDYKAEAQSAWMAPMAGAGTFMTPYPGQKIMNGADKGSVMFQFEQAIPNKSKQQAKKDYFLSMKNGVKAEREIMLNEMRAYARELYFNWIIAEKKISLLEKNYPLLEMLKKIAEVRYPYSQSPLGEIYKAEAEIQNNKNDILELKAETDYAKARINSLMQLPPEHDFQPDTSFLINYQPILLPDSVLLSEKRKDAELLRFNTISLQKSIEAKALERKPEFSIRFDHMSPLGGMMPQAYSIMGMMTIPLAPWSAKGYKTEIKSMNADILAMERERSALLNETQGRLTGLHYRIEKLNQKISGLKDYVIPAYQKTLDANFLSYQENNLPLSEVLISWKEVRNKEMELLNESLNLYKLIIEYEKELFQ